MVYVNGNDHSFMMEFEQYNSSFEDFVITLEEEADAKLRVFRQQCVRDFISRLNRQQREWDSTFRELLSKSQEVPEEPPLQSFQEGIANLENQLLKETNKQPSQAEKHVTFSETVHYQEIPSKQQQEEEEKKPEDKPAPVQILEEKKVQNAEDDGDITDFDLYTGEHHEYFTNIMSVKEFIKIQELLERNRQSFVDLNTNPALKSLKNDLNLFIRTQINSISNSDTEHLDTKIRLLTSLFTGRTVSFQDRLVDASRHPQGQLFAMDLAAQTFVTVGTRLINSVPAIAKSMATVVNGIINNNLPLFRDLIIGHLQERCPYLVPMYPRRSDFKGQPDQDVKYKIACGYSYDTSKQTLENEEKYLARMRSMVLIYASILIQNQIGHAWTWLASFLSLKPRPVITATVLQAFLQEASKSMSTAYGRQYRKLLDFIKTDYLAMVEDVTKKSTEKQPLIKLKNLLSSESNLIAPPKVGSIFGAIRIN